MAKKKDKEVSPFPEYDNLTVEQLAVEMHKLDAEYSKVKAAASKIYEKYDSIRMRYIPNAMEDAGIERVKITGVGTLGLRTEASCKQLDPEALTNWLREHEHGELIRETINASSLKSFIKQCIQQGLETPPDDILLYAPYTFAVITGKVVTE